MLWGVDLSAKYSAACGFERVGPDPEEGFTATLWASTECEAYQGTLNQTEQLGLRLSSAKAVLIEDVPPHLPNSRVLRLQYRAQGALIRELFPRKHRSGIAFVQPSVWQAHFGIKGKSKERKALAKELAEADGLVLPDWVAEMHYKKDRDKAHEDLADSWMIASFGLEFWDEYQQCFVHDKVERYAWQ